MKIFLPIIYVFFSWVLYTYNILKGDKEFPFVVLLGIIYTLIYCFFIIKNKTLFNIVKNWILNSAIIIFTYYFFWFSWMYYGLQLSGWDIKLFDFNCPDKVTIPAFILLVLPFYIYPILTIWLTDNLNKLKLYDFLEERISLWKKNKKQNSNF